MCIARFINETLCNYWHDLAILLIRFCVANLQSMRIFPIVYGVHIFRRLGKKTERRTYPYFEVSKREPSGKMIGLVLCIFYCLLFKFITEYSNDMSRILVLLSYTNLVIYFCLTLANTIWIMSIKWFWNKNIMMTIWTYKRCAFDSPWSIYQIAQYDIISIAPS